MTTVFPWDALPIGKLRWRPNDSYVVGPENMLGESQRRNPSPGFRWLAELTDIALADDATVLLWEALLLDWRMGAELTVVPRFGGPLTPLRPGQAPRILTAHSDGTTFSDGTLYSQSSITAVLAEDLAVGGTTATIAYAGGARLSGGHPFGMIGPKYRNRLYGIRRYLSTPANGAADGTYVVKLGPNAREPYLAGTAINFGRPDCVMRPRMQEAEKMWPVFEPGFFARVGITFEETYRMTDDGDA